MVDANETATVYYRAHKALVRLCAQWLADNAPPLKPEHRKLARTILFFVDAHAGNENLAVNSREALLLLNSLDEWRAEADIMRAESAFLEALHCLFRRRDWQDTMGYLEQAKELELRDNRYLTLYQADCLLHEYTKRAQLFFMDYMLRDEQPDRPDCDLGALLRRV